MKDWAAWHAGYDDPSSGLSARPPGRCSPSARAEPPGAPRPRAFTVPG